MTKRIREYASSIIIFTLLAGVLSFYYLKYVPEQKSEYNRTAFLELNQIQYALLNKTKALHDALRNIIHQPQPDISSLAGFYIKPANPKFNDSDNICSSHFVRDDSLDTWQLRFPVNPDSCKKIPTYSLSRNSDSLMTDLVSTYKDIFDGYLLINNQDDDGDGTDKGEIIFQSGDLNMSFTVNTDSLLKKKGAVSVNDLQDVTIEGNTYKIFLYPFSMGSQELILAGLISESNYRNATQKIPFSFFTVFAVLLLLLVIHLPILKIYMLGPNERIRETDIRLIIGSYFIAAFFGFFLFTKLFLDKVQAVQNEKNLHILSEKITGNFQRELGTISRQLCFFDDTLKKLISEQDTTYLKALSETPKDGSTITFLDKLFKPFIYPYPNNVFWIDSSGRQAARWGFKQALTKSPLINVNDRSYFKDFIKGQPLTIPGTKDPLAVQPTLSKLEGEYVVTIAKLSTVAPYQVNLEVPDANGKMKDSCVHISPFLIGLSSKMHSIYKVVMPPGYGFSIIDEAGQILYDSKPGLPLLSNIFHEMENSEGIHQSAHYRNTRYFKSTVLRGRDMALLSTPVDGMPYQLLVYYNRFRSDGFEVHLITLSAGLMGLVICLVIFSSLINRWSKIKYRMLESRSPHFEWLHPSADPLKQKYYNHLIRWLLLLTGVYLLAWLLIETLATGSEFSLLFISLLFPFYIAIFYYELRERYYDVQERKTDINWYYSRPSIVLRGALLIIIILINCFTSFVEFSFALAIPVLLTQVIWIIMIALSTFRFRYFMMWDKNPSQGESKLKLWYKKRIAGFKSAAAAKTHRLRSSLFTLATYRSGHRQMKKNTPENFEDTAPPPKIEKTDPKYKIPVTYIWAILLGVTLISIIPASGIFWLFFRQETGLYQNADQLSMSKDIDQRAETINKKIKEFKINPKDPTDRLNIGKLKFEHGIYMIYGQTFADNKGTQYAPLNYPTNEFIQLHDRFFPSDSIVMDWISPADAAADRTWYFAKQPKDDRPELLYSKRRDGINPNPFRLTTDANATRTTMGLMTHSFSGTGTAFSILFIVGLCLSMAIAYFLTLSLTKRIFLVELEQVTSLDDKTTSLAKEYYNLSNAKPALQKMISDTCRDWDISTLDPSQNNIPFADPGFPRLIDIYYFEKKLPIRVLEDKMPWLVDKLKPVYTELWNTLTISQKFILYDFALDGFSNYKAGKDLQTLISKGLLFFDDLRLSPMTLSFQEFVLGKKDDPELKDFQVITAKEDTWKKFRSPLLILLTALGIFIFLTQQEVYQKVTGLLAALTTLVPLLSNLLNRSSGKSDGA